MRDVGTAEPVCSSATGAVEMTIEAVEKDLGGFTVRRVLPASERRRVGPFVFFDHMGAAVFAAGEGIAVRPHPHIGLATITYLFEGEIVHRDSLGCVQPIQPGAVNLMVAGRGIVHSERAGEDLNVTSRLHGIQSWMALPNDQEECEPGFAHHPAADIPQLDVGGVTVRVVIGKAYGRTSPVKVFSPTLYLECRLPPGCVLALPDGYRELAAYVVGGAVRLDQHIYKRGLMALMRRGQPPRIHAEVESHVVVIGGEPVGERHIWWNFVSSSAERIERAKSDWQERRFEPVPGETEYIPLPH